MTQEEFEKVDSMVSFDKKLSSACNVDNAYVKYKSRHIFDDDGRKYYQNGLKLLIKDDNNKKPYSSLLDPKFYHRKSRSDLNDIENMRK